MIKPFALGELADACGRCCDGADDARASRSAACGSTPWRTQCVVGDAHATLTPIEFRVLSQLLDPPGQVVRRRSLATAGWPDGSVVLDNTLDACVSRLRKKLAALGATVTIDTVHGVGYRIAI